MKKKIKIIYNPSNNPQDNGLFFEDIVKNIFEKQRYHIDQRINFTGMEIDLIATHMDRNEKIYIECKAKESLLSDDIKKFTFNCMHRKIVYGYFLSAIEFEHQVGGLIDEMKNDSRYSNLYFWGPEKIINLLVDNSIIKEFYNTKKGNISKLILCYTYKGIFYIAIELDKTYPKKYYILDAKNLVSIFDNEINELLKENVNEISDLEFVPIEIEDHFVEESHIIETIAEVQESEHWFDYLPASTEHFIGRKEMVKNIFTFLNSVRNHSTQRRIYYIDGKSGWGKSSLITNMRGKCRNKYYNNKYYLFAVDARSASTSNFVAKSFKMLIDKAIRDNFIGTNLDTYDIKIISGYDILASDSIKHLMLYLEKENKVLILIFDQFEDVFRKRGLFHAFYKFLLDVNANQSNLILGFSWKSEINIPIDHESYHQWQQSKEYTYPITVREFNSSEINGIINQLEQSLTEPLDISLKRKLIEGSQGFPWFTKKLCIHVYNQYIHGKSQAELIELNLNCEDIFNNDIEGLNPEESRALNYIAKRSYDGEFFDTTEVDETIPDLVIKSLIHKRLVVKSGSKYNVYWDIFRDYLVLNEIPPIGESYILHSLPNICLEVFLLFNNNRYQIEQLESIHPRGLTKQYIDNILRELINLGIIRKSIDNYYYISNPDININEHGFKTYLHKKFQNYTPYMKLKESNLEKITLDNIVDILKKIFKGTTDKERTWKLYGSILITWFNYANMDISNKFEFRTHERKRSKKEQLKKNIPNRTPNCVFNLFINLDKEIKNKGYHKLQNSLSDLKLLGWIEYKNKNIEYTSKGEEVKKYKDINDMKEQFSLDALQINKVKTSVEVLFRNPKYSIKEFEKLSSMLLSEIRTTSGQKYGSKILLSWARFIVQNTNKNKLNEALSK